MLAVIGGSKNQRHLLEGAKFKFEVCSDYQNLKIFYESAEIEQKASLLGIILVKIQFHFEICTRNKNKKSR